MRKWYIQLHHRHRTVLQFFKAVTLFPRGYAKEANAKSWKEFVQLNIWPSSWPIKTSGCPQVLPLLQKREEWKVNMEREPGLFCYDLKLSKNNSEGDLLRHRSNDLQDLHSNILHSF